MLGDTPQRDREEVAGSVREETEEQEQLRLLLLAALVRIARRVCWGYMRQLWDFDFDDDADDVEDHKHNETIDGHDDDAYDRWLKEDLLREAQHCEVGRYYWLQCSAVRCIMQQ
jgi:hypothetical protein